MAIKHLVLELYCSQTWSDAKGTAAPSFCKNGIGEPGYHCLDNRCTYIASTYAPHEIAYAGEYGEVLDMDTWIGFGGEMIPADADEARISELKKTWEEVCRRKIQEAYEEYLKLLGNQPHEFGGKGQI
ncbi:hypothetical protein YDYSY3_03060 [Paenibacillus chitinolyticus]|uniref:hypothetical protein n=1 Tax=Paenibacillus chitinolyticus TaxID=79263 RepID=UPI0026E4FD7A|nr:hypothetical protein [Paenibacillus chitinolyticus]GKS09306.1 hypothetical protein YDYSY3_03060 [Paenibacillus chitinolyticus]